MCNLYTKCDLRGAPGRRTSFRFEDVLAVEHDVIPLNGADMFQQGGIDSIGDRVALAENPGDLPRLPINDARQDQG